MKEKTIAEVQQLVGQPTYALINGTWVPPTGQRLFTPDEFYELFRDESVLFLGDSTQRRAADTLHVLIEHRNSSTNGNHYLYEWKNNKMHHTRVIGNLPNVTISAYNRFLHSPRGRIDNRMDQFYRSIKSFRYESRRNHTMIIVGAGAWDNQKLGHTSNELVSLVNETIHHLHTAIPSSVQIFWKTAGWGSWFDWGYKEPNVENQCNNYQIYLVNKVAKDVIQSINADNLKLLDWSREILPYSFDRQSFPGMKAEDYLSGNPDNNPWHVGVTGRMLLLQMLAWEVNQQKALFPAASLVNAAVPSDDNRYYSDSTNRTTILDANSTSASDPCSYKLPSTTRREDTIFQPKEHWKTVGNIGTTPSMDETVVDLVVGRDHHSSSYLQKFPDERISHGQQLLSLFVVFLSVAVILARMRHHEDHRIRRSRPILHV